MNTGTLLTHSARHFPDKRAIVHGPRILTYAQLDRRTNQLANALDKLGLSPQDHVAILMRNCPEMLEATFACFKMGCGAVPINFRLHPSEFGFIVNHSQAKVVIVSPEFNDSIQQIRENLPHAKHLITISEAEGELLDYESLLVSESDQFDDREVMPEDVAWLFYTSGTTGQPKGAMLTHRNLMAMTVGFFADMCPGFGFDEAVLHAAPLSHGSGLYALPNIAKAATNVILESKSFDPNLVLKTIERQRVTNFFGAPTMIKKLIDSPQIDQYDHRSLKAIVYGGAPMLVDDLTKAIEKFGPCLVQLYGQGEAPMTITYLRHQDHVLDDDAVHRKRLGSAGFARTDVEVQIVDSDDHPLSAGKLGQIVTRSDLVMKGYWRNPEATAKALKNGWLHTGDIGYMDERGYLFIMDRSNDMIISGGENIYPREVEEVLVQHPAVREVAVLGIPDPEWGEAIKAVVSLAPGKTASEVELINFCKDHIASYKKPKSIVFVDELPKNNYGKIMKRELREKHWEGKMRRVV